MTRAVLDANVVISGTIAPQGRSAAILDAWRNGGIAVVTAPAILAEINEKLRLPRIRDKYHLREDEIAELVMSIGQAAMLVPGATEVESPPPDPDDIMLYAAALESGADYIVTGDAALLRHAWDGPAGVISPRAFWERELAAD